MPFVGAPTSTFVSVSDNHTFETVKITDAGYTDVADNQNSYDIVKITDVGYTDVADNQHSYDTKVYYGPGVKRTPKVITFKNQT